MKDFLYQSIFSYMNSVVSTKNLSHCAMQEDTDITEHLCIVPNLRWSDFSGTPNSLNSLNISFIQEKLKYFAYQQSCLTFQICQTKPYSSCMPFFKIPWLNYCNYNELLGSTEIGCLSVCTKQLISGSHYSRNCILFNKSANRRSL